MTSNQFYIPRIDGASSRIVLEGEEHRHLAKSARVRKGEAVGLFDDEGNRAVAVVEAVGRERTTLRVVERSAPEGARMRLTLVQALIPAKKMESILEKTSELGIAEFVPVETDRSLKGGGERQDRKTERWARIAREAVKQSKGAAIPAVRPLGRLKAVLESPEPGLRIFMSERGGRPLREFLCETGKGGRTAPADVVVFIGPEGGWSEAEEEAFREAGCTPASLGRRILKCETAAVAAVGMLQHFWNA